MRVFREIVWVAVVGALLIVSLGQAVYAERFTSSNYILDASELGNSYGGSTSDSDYKLTSSGGESVIGQGSGGSYVISSGYVAQLANSIQLTVQPSGLLLYYPLDATSGSLAADLSASGNDGYTIGNPSWTTGKISGALALNGSSQYISSPSISSVSALTVEAWVKPTSTQTSTILSKASSSSDNQGTLSLASNVPSFSLTIGGSQVTVAASTAIGTSWTQIAGTYDGSTVRLYVDGSMVGQTAASGSIATNSLNWTIGRDTSTATNFFSGDVDQVKLFSRALSTNGVAAEYNAGDAGKPAGLSFASDIIPGYSQTSQYDVIVATDAYNYTVAINQNHNLTDGTNTIPSISGTIASPITWNEGTTKGLGFTLYSSTATAIDSAWGSGSDYAALPSLSTSIYTRNGQQQGGKDILSLGLRLDVDSAQASGTYANTMTITGTTTP